MEIRVLRGWGESAFQATGRKENPWPGTEIEYLWFPKRWHGVGGGGEAMCGRRRESLLEVGSKWETGGGEGQDKEACLLLALLCDLRQAPLRASVSMQIKQ